MNFKLVSFGLLVASTLAGCRHADPSSAEGPPTVKLSSFEVLKLAAGGGNIHVEGLGATPNSEVVMILNYSTPSEENEQMLGTLKSDGSGVFSYRGFQKCLFAADGPRPSRVTIEARDSATGWFGETPELDPAFLICPK